MPVFFLLFCSERLQAVMSRLGVSEEAIRDANIHPIHPSFRVIALAEPPMEGARSWLTDELQSMFHFHGVSPLKLAEEKRVVSTLGAFLSTLSLFPPTPLPFLPFLPR